MADIYVNYPQSSGGGSSGSQTGVAYTVGALDGAAANANGGTIGSFTFYQQSAAATFPGLVSSASQTFAGVKTFNSSPIVGTLSINAPVLSDGSKALVSGSISLTSQVTGILPVANGGSGVGSQFQMGSVIFVDSAGKYTEDNNNLFYSVGSAFLGIGTNAPAAALNVNTNITGTPNINGTVSKFDGKIIDNITGASSTIGSQVFSIFTQPQITAVNSSVTTTFCDTVRINGPPAAGFNETLTNITALRIISGNVVGSGTVGAATSLNVVAPTGATNNYAAVFTGKTSVNSAAPLGQFQVNGASVGSSGAFGQTFYVLPGIFVDGNAAATITQNYACLIGQPTFTCSMSAVTTTTLATMRFNGPPIAGNNQLATNASTLLLAAGTTVSGSVSNAFGINCAAPTGAQVNYAAVFTGGSVGIGTTAPVALLSLTGAQTGSPTTNGTIFNQAAINYTDASTSGTLAQFYSNNIIQTTIIGSNTGLTTTTAAQFRVAGAVIAGTNEGITNSHAILVSAAASVTGSVTNAFGISCAAPLGAANNYAAVFTGGDVGFGTTTPGARVHITGKNTGSFSQTNGVNLTVSGQTFTDGSTSASSTLTQLNFSTFLQPNLAGVNSSMTTTNASVLTLNGPVISDTNNTITNSHALRILANTVVNAGLTTNAYGLTVAAPTGAANNYAAQFTGGNVGIGTAAPTNTLQVSGTAQATTVTSPTHIVGSITFVQGSTGGTYQLVYPPQQGGSNQAMTNSSGSGVLSWSTIITSPTSSLTIGSVTINQTAGGSAHTISLPSSQGSSSASYLTNNGAGGLAWQANPGPTVQTFSSGSGTYTKPVGVRYIRVNLVGGGGGGAGSGTTGNVGTTGTSSVFSTLIGGGGIGGTAAGSSNSAGGAASGGDVNLKGGDGGGPVGSASGLIGSPGGNSAYGGAGCAGQPGIAGSSAAVNSGSGGGGGGGGAGVISGGGGGAAGFVQKLISSVSATYSYYVADGGAAGAAGTSGFTGGKGGTGFIIVEEFFV